MSERCLLRPLNPQRSLIRLNVGVAPLNLGNETSCTFCIEPRYRSDTDLKPPSPALLSIDHDHQKLIVVLGHDPGGCRVEVLDGGHSVCYLYVAAALLKAEADGPLVTVRRENTSDVANRWR